MASLRETMPLSWAWASVALMDRSLRALLMAAAEKDVCTAREESLEAPEVSKELVVLLKVTMLDWALAMSFRVACTLRRKEATEVCKSVKVFEAWSNEVWEVFSLVDRAVRAFWVESTLVLASSVAEITSSRAPDTSPSNLFLAFLSWTTTALLTWVVNWELMLPSKVFAPMSVTLGAMELSFSFT